MFFEFSIGGFINFFLGMVTGSIAIIATYIYFVIRGINIDLENVKRPTVDVNLDDLELMVKEKQKLFKKSRKSGNHKLSKLTFDLSFDLTNQIATYFFPTSKYPMYELSVHELMNLNHYITDRISEILNKPLLKNTMKLRITQIMQMFDKKRRIEENKVMKAAKKLKVGKVAKYAGAAVNIINPVYWFRKLVINTSVDVMQRKICVVIIGIVGEETIKIYSKKLFDDPLELDLVEKEVTEFLENGPNEEEDEKE